MLHVWWATSGQPLASVTQEELSDVRTLKQHLRALHGFPICIQQLLHDGHCLEDGCKLEAPMDLQLVLLTVSNTQGGQAEAELGLAAIQGHVEVARFLLAAGPEWSEGPSPRFCPGQLGDGAIAAGSWRR
ncbi:ANKRD17 [Symbiodinium natans]|uniref:ANKRD17 protein n=1 Tax=Symbiodinium natans TaxID=878477 RepID=A0A812K0F5_9DINO|nr:ANKRD17 [Symbiodinium natans]